MGERESEQGFRVKKKRQKRIRGRCDGCGKQPRVLTRLESGQHLCRTCLNRLRKPKQLNPDASADSEILDEAGTLGIELPPGISNRDAVKWVGLARRQFEISDALLAEDYDQLIHLQDDVMCYVVDLWEQMTCQSPNDANIPWQSQQKFAALIVSKHRELAVTIHHVQRQRERRKQTLEQQYFAAHPDHDRLPWDTFKQPIAPDQTCQEITERLKVRWKMYLPKRPGLLGRLFGGR